MLASISMLAAFIAPWPTVRPKTRADVSMIKIAKGGGDFDDFQQDMLGRLGLDDGESDDNYNEEMIFPDEDDVMPPESDDSETDGTMGVKLTPRSGKEELLGWSHEDESIVLDLLLPEGTRAKELVCEVSKSGFMRVERGDTPLLRGQLALPVDRTELCWAVDEQSDGSKLLCIELPMKGVDTSSRMTSVDCIFDESLEVNGQPCMVPGLSGVGGRA